MNDLDTLNELLDMLRSLHHDIPDLSIAGIEKRLASIIWEIETKLED